MVMRAGAGVDNLAVPVLAERGVVVANAAGANAIAVAELTLAHLLNLDRRVSDQVETLRKGQWRRLEFAKGPKGLYGRSLAVLGVGYIGREVIRRAAAFGMRVRAWSRSLTEEEAKELSADFCASPEAAVEDADALSVHLALSEQTRGLVDDVLLSKLRPGALVVNMSRGGIVDEAALLKAVEEPLGVRIRPRSTRIWPVVFVQASTFSRRSLARTTPDLRTRPSWARAACTAPTIRVPGPNRPQRPWKTLWWLPWMLTSRAGPFPGAWHEAAKSTDYADYAYVEKYSNATKFRFMWFQKFRATS
eukprot:s1868_g14.t1